MDNYDTQEIKQRIIKILEDMGAEPL